MAFELPRGADLAAAFGVIIAAAAIWGGLIYVLIELLIALF